MKIFYKILFLDSLYKLKFISHTELLSKLCMFVDVLQQTLTGSKNYKISGWLAPSEIKTSYLLNTSTRLLLWG